MGDGPVIVWPGEGHRVGNVEFLARTRDTPRFNFGIIEMARGVGSRNTSTKTKTTRFTSSRAR